jgi:hypothetical protein
MSAAEEYLWDPSAPVDRDVVALETALGSFRQPPPGFDSAAAHAARIRGRRVRRIRRISVAAAAVVAVGALWLVPSSESWEVEAIAGVPSIRWAPGAVGQGARSSAAGGPAGTAERGESGAEGASIAAGMVVETDGISSARLRVGRNGFAELSPASRVRVLRADGDEQRFSLEQGVLAAHVSGTAGAFVLQTPFARAVGTRGASCEFEVRVDSSGVGRVGVSEGTLTLEADGRHVFVPAGNAASIGSVRGPGLPFPVGATARFKSLVGTIDSLGASTERLSALLAVADRASTITLFHLLPRLGTNQRLQVVDRMASLVPPPPGVTRDGLAQLDSSMLARWEPSLRRSWEGARPPVWRRLWNGVRGAF